MSTRTTSSAPLKEIHSSSPKCSKAAFRMSWGICRQGWKRGREGRKAGSSGWGPGAGRRCCALWRNGSKGRHMALNNHLPLSTLIPGISRRCLALGEGLECRVRRHPIVQRISRRVLWKLPVLTWKACWFRKSGSRSRKNRYRRLEGDHPGHSGLRRADEAAPAHSRRTWPEAGRYPGGDRHPEAAGGRWNSSTGCASASRW